MTFHYHLSGEPRKQLVHAMAELLESKPHYLGIPSYAYEVGPYTVSRDGDISYDENTTDADEAEQLIEALMEKGFEPDDATEPELEQIETTEAEEPVTGFTVSMPMDGFDAGSLNRLHTLIASKRTLLMKALDVDSLPVEVTEDRVNFPWFHRELDEAHQQAYMWLIIYMCAMAKNSKRITAKDKPTGNDKYAFRCFLLRLGFIGDDSKRLRKVLLEKLDGSSAFRSGAPKAHTAPTAGDETEVEE